ncbi:DNA topoisomerase 1 [Thelohanellus kitauei]|uniref:DNA topoisomerase 1 n=1 Tax=Thelohanellus kitauei TaxID=669202 RepID=A0A0C2J5J7_THEKT|nr:DNA topoisomerase 1 [Thelohanellus kitauei]
MDNSGTISRELDNPLDVSGVSENVFKTPKKRKNKSCDSTPIKVKKQPHDVDIDLKKPSKKVDKPKKSKKENEGGGGVWRWWNELPHPDGVHWITLEHNGPYFAPIYEPLPRSVKFYYDSEPIDLSVESEEIASFYAKMLDSDYCKKDIFNNNFFSDWRTFMTPSERKTIQKFEKCDFSKMFEYYKEEREKRKAMTKDEKLVLKKENEKIAERYGVCKVDGHTQKVGNFRIEPPGLFRGRGDHPKQGKIKRRVMPEDVIINISEDAKVPEPPPGHSWKSIVHDNKVTWLANWIENISGSYKYVMLNPTAKIKGTKDMEKYDLARGLHACIDVIRLNYKRDMSSEDMRSRQRAVALYFIDRLALRAGHEKEDGESADTVGCCSLRVEHIKLEKDPERRVYIVNFDFLGKDSVRYVNKVEIDKKVGLVIE